MQCMTICPEYPLAICHRQHLATIETPLPLLYMEYVGGGTQPGEVLKS